MWRSSLKQVAVDRVVNILEWIHYSGATTLVEFVEAAGLAEALQGNGPFSVAAPSNDAFAKVWET